AAAVGAYGRSGGLKALLADFTAQLAEAVDSEGQGLRNTLQFFVQVFKQSSLCPGCRARCVPPLGPGGAAAFRRSRGKDRSKLPSPAAHSLSLGKRHMAPCDG